MEKAREDVLRETDDEAIRLAKTLIRTARFGALAVLDPETGGPFASRVAVATDCDGTPIILISRLSTHTKALDADTRCSVLLGEPGKGDPLAHPRITLLCRAERIDRADAAHGRIERRFLTRNPKSKLYAGFPDFAFFRLNPDSASLNGGFGRAYALTRQDVLTGLPSLETIAAVEEGALSHMNADHADAVARYAKHFGGSAIVDGWRMTGIDPEGFDLVAGESALRIFFDRPLQEAKDVHHRLVEMAVAARRQEEAAQTT